MHARRDEGPTWESPTAAELDRIIADGDNLAGDDEGMRKALATFRLWREMAGPKVPRSEPNNKPKETDQ